MIGRMRERLLMDRNWRFALGHAADDARDFGFRRSRDLVNVGGSSKIDAIDIQAGGAVKLRQVDGKWTLFHGGARATEVAAVNELVEAIKSVVAGQIYISPKVSQRVIQHLRRPKKDREGLDITELFPLLHGHGHQRIACRYGLEAATIKAG